jgi:hypothetical protein
MCVQLRAAGRRRLQLELARSTAHLSQVLMMPAKHSSDSLHATHASPASVTGGGFVTREQATV